MPYGNLTLQMRDALAPLIKGRLVYDLGAGDCDHGRTLYNLGAGQVVCVDKEDTPLVPKNVVFVHGYIDRIPIPADLDVLFLGWPQNYHIPGLVHWMEAAKTIIYLGHNFGGTACGFPAMFEHLLTRRLTLYIPNERNTLLVVEEPLAQSPRSKTPEEAAFFADVIVPWGSSSS